MLDIKVVYDDSHGLELYHKYKNAPIFTFYNESYSDEKKKAWKLKNQFGARELPFVCVFDGDNPIHTIWAENTPDVYSSLTDWLSDYIKEHSKKGWIKIEKVSEINPSTPNGIVREGYTYFFIEGAGCDIRNHDYWYQTSVITKILWDEGLFHTLNSIYKFKFKEDESTSD